MRICIIRHADPDYPNHTLTAKGFKEAELLGKRYSADDFDDIYCSTLNRAKLTCDAVIKGKKEVKYVDWLQEVFYWIERDGKTQSGFDYEADFFVKNKEMLDVDNYIDNPMFDVNDQQKRYKEICNEVDKVLAKHGCVREGHCYVEKEKNDDVVAFFCHYGTMSVILSHILNIPHIFITAFFDCQPSGITTLFTCQRCGKSIFKVLNYGDRSHINKKASLYPFSEIE